jgi:hypothetical protein
MLEEKNARTGQFERLSYKLLGFTQKGGMCLTCKSIDA